MFETYSDLISLVDMKNYVEMMDLIYYVLGMYIIELIKSIRHSGSEFDNDRNCLTSVALANNKIYDYFKRNIHRINPFGGYINTISSLKLTNRLIHGKTKKVEVCLFSF
jgi:hypothetical protein